jgi:hypothetical protein
VRAPPDERRQFYLLFHNFFKRLFESELLPEGVDTSDALSSIIALFAAPAAVVTLWLFPKYALVVDLAPHELEALSRGDKLFFIGYSMAAVGFLTVLVWDSLFRDRRDAIVLGTIPLRPRVVLPPDSPLSPLSLSVSPSQ